MLADEKDHTLYTTVPVESNWKQVVVPESLQEKFVLVSEKPAFMIVVPMGKHQEVFAASDQATNSKVVDRETGRVLVELSIPAGVLVKAKLP